MGIIIAAETRDHDALNIEFSSSFDCCKIVNQINTLKVNNNQTY